METERTTSEFPSEASRKAGRDKYGTFEDYILDGTRVRFRSAGTPKDTQLWEGLGTDGGVPSEILTAVLISSEFGDYKLPASLINDLGNPNIRQPAGYDYVRLRKEDTILRIAMSNSDGAGSYQAVFELDLSKGEARRFIRDHLEPTFTLTHDWTALLRKPVQPRGRS